MYRLPEQLLSDLRLDADVFLQSAVKGELKIHDCLGVLVSRKAVTLVVCDLVYITLHQYSALIFRQLFHGPFTLSLLTISTNISIRLALVLAARVFACRSSLLWN